MHVFVLPCIYRIHLCFLMILVSWNQSAATSCCGVPDKMAATWDHFRHSDTSPCWILISSRSHSSALMLLSLLVTSCQEDCFSFFDNDYISLVPGTSASRRSATQHLFTNYSLWVRRYLGTLLDHCFTQDDCKSVNWHNNLKLAEVEQQLGCFMGLAKAHVPPIPNWFSFKLIFAIHSIAQKRIRFKVFKLWKNTWCHKGEFCRIPVALNMPQVNFVFLL